MLQNAEQLEELITVVSALDRPALVEQFRSYKGSFPLDFSREFLEQQSMDRLRHLFVAVCLQSKQMPQFRSSSAA